jgi:lipopolysaccharide export system permease protein
MFAGGELFKITELVAEFHASLFTAGKLVFLYLPSVIAMTLPMSMLVATLIGFGRLSGDSEVVALFASGISLRRIAIPGIIMSIFVTCGSFVLSEVVAPGASTEHDRIVKELRHDVNTGKTQIAGHDIANGETQSVYYINGGVDSARGVARDVFLVRYVKNKPFAFIYGKEARWSGEEHPDEWSFRDGYVNNLGASPYVTLFREDAFTIKKTPQQLALYEKKPEEMSFDQLRHYIRMLQQSGEDTAMYRVRLYQKIALPIASLVFALIGTPLGLRPQRSSSAMGLGLSIVIIFLYWVLTHYMSILGENGTMSPAAASFIPTLAGVAAGAILIMRATK